MSKMERIKGSVSNNNRVDFFPKGFGEQVIKRQPLQNLPCAQWPTRTSQQSINYDKRKFVSSRNNEENMLFKGPEKQMERYCAWRPQQPLEYQKRLSTAVSEKYWRRRYSLFSRYDEGIRLDDESWFSVTPEKLAEHHARRLACDVIVDGFCGAGGNAIQFAKTCKKVIAIDLDPAKIEIAKHNAAIYGVAHKIHFIVGDFIKLAPNLRADMVFLSPPWGGPDYVKQDVFCLEDKLLPVSIHELLDVARYVSPNVAAFLPKNSNTDILYKNYRVEVEANYVGKWQNAITVYLGDLVRGSSTESFVPFF